MHSLDVPARNQYPLGFGNSSVEQGQDFGHRRTMLPNGCVPESNINNKLALVVHIQLRGIDDQAHYYRAILRSEPTPLNVNRDSGDGCVFHLPAAQQFLGNIQQSVFIDVVGFGEDPKGRGVLQVPSVVRLHTLNKRLSCWTQRTDSRKLFGEILDHPANRELQVPFLLSSEALTVGNRQRVGEMIEGTPQVMEAISRDQ